MYLTKNHLANFKDSIIFSIYPVFSKAMLIFTRITICINVLVIKILILPFSLNFFQLLLISQVLTQPFLKNAAYTIYKHLLFQTQL